MNNKNQTTQNAQNTQASHNPSQRTGESASGQAWNEESRQYWRNQYAQEPYAASNRNFEQYEPAYRTGAEGRAQYGSKQFTDVEGELRSQYEANRDASSPRWDEGGRAACQAAWMREDQSQQQRTSANRGGNH